MEIPTTRGHRWESPAVALGRSHLIETTLFVIGEGAPPSLRHPHPRPALFVAAGSAPSSRSLPRPPFASRAALPLLYPAPPTPAHPQAPSAPELCPRRHPQASAPPPELKRPQSAAPSPMSDLTVHILLPSAVDRPLFRNLNGNK
uniref:Predicted protein n=1 Tax=Hordeum vulgare subsp. vulgare TaxID=112509 RepID=F2DCC2_HORVV|nr:predicted protein [Hordeum vulgare subsp. vulgare]